jgi:hypothetical protein
MQIEFFGSNLYLLTLQWDHLERKGEKRMVRKFFQVIEFMSTSSSEEVTSRYGKYWFYEIYSQTRMVVEDNKCQLDYMTKIVFYASIHLLMLSRI